MVPLLVPNIFDDLLFVGRAHRKRAITALPSEIAMISKPLMDPARGIGFHHPQAFGDGNIGGEADQHVDVVLQAIDDAGRSSHLADDAAHVGEEVRPDLCIQEAHPVLRAENYVRQQG